ncbi:MAG: hypothetical protein A2234_02785 [Elusimicrobia bacterium RIFOXYA2_FULL_58_8]|nr:MAG: hypothetical protein A2285_03465 [Elusimicrobia bacterium RIFOXYA12_FULL_57_11]OGS17151.1 MAG: hypothetical protein A2234_02785 [Elusimicrobia bacterium RIFOXYA2_FULL_58_8]
MHQNRQNARHGPDQGYDLVFLRHGHALSTGEAGVLRDCDRPLSERGAAQARKTAIRLKQAGFLPELIIASPFSRAATTADIAAEIFPGARRLGSAALSDGDAAGVLKLLAGAALRPGAGLLLVGHQPLLGFLAGRVMIREAFPLAPAGFVRINTNSDGFAPDPAATLTEFYTPAGNIF